MNTIRHMKSYRNKLHKFITTTENGKKQIKNENIDNITLEQADQTILKFLEQPDIRSFYNTNFTNFALRKMNALDSKIFGMKETSTI